MDGIGTGCGDICHEFCELDMGRARDDKDYEGEETSG